MGNSCKLKECCDKNVLLQTEQVNNEGDSKRPSIDIEINIECKEEDNIQEILEKESKTQFENIILGFNSSNNYNKNHEKSNKSLILPKKRESIFSSKDKLIYEDTILSLGNFALNKELMSRKISSNSNSNESYNLVIKILTKLFCRINKQLISKLSLYVKTISIGKNKTILSNSSNNHYLIIVLSGEVGCYINNKLYVVFSKGDYFGNYSNMNQNISYHTKHNYIKYNAISDTSISILSGDNLHLFLSFNNELLNDKKEYINYFPLFSYLNEKDKITLSELITMTNFNKDSKLILPKDHDYIVYLKEGSFKLEISCHNSQNKIPMLLTKGNIYNIEILFSDDTTNILNFNSSNYNFIAIEESVIVFISKQIIISTFNDITLIQKIMDNIIKIIISNSPFLYNLILEGILKTRINLKKYDPFSLQVNNHLNSTNKNESLTKHFIMSSMIVGSTPQISTNNDVYTRTSDNKFISVDKKYYENIYYNAEKKLMDNFKLIVLDKDMISEGLINKNKLIILLYGIINDYFTNKPICQQFEIISKQYLDNLSNWELKEKCIILVGDLRSILSNNNSKEYIDDNNKLTNRKLYLKYLPFMQCLSVKSQNDILENIIEESFISKELIKKKSNSLNSVIIVKSGSIVKISGLNKEKIILKEGSVIGLEYLTNCNNQINKKDDFSLYANNQDNLKNILISIKIEDFMLILSNKMIDFFSFYMENKLIKTNIDLYDISIIALLGEGSFGRVNLIRIKDKYYALKMIKHEFLSKKSFALNSLFQEIKNSVAIISPFVTKPIAFEYDNKFCYILYNYTSSCSLYRVFTENQKNFANIFKLKEIFVNLISAIDSIHEFNIIHRDIKPDNILINKDYSLQIIDFGVSKELKDFTNTIIGTPYYMSPEMVQGESYGSSCDIWASGTILYWMLFGVTPFEEENDINIMDIYERIVRSTAKIPDIANTRFMDLKNVNELNEYYTLIKLVKLMLKQQKDKRIMSINDIKNTLSFNWYSVKDINYTSKLCYNEIDTSPLENKFYNKKDSAINGISLCKGISYNCYMSETKCKKIHNLKNYSFYKSYLDRFKDEINEYVNI